MFNNISVGVHGDSTYVSLHLREDDFVMEYDVVFQDVPEARDFDGEVYWSRVTAYQKPTVENPQPEYGETKHAIGSRS